MVEEMAGRMGKKTVAQMVVSTDGMMAVLMALWMVEATDNWTVVEMVHTVVGLMVEQMANVLAVL